MNFATHKRSGTQSPGWALALVLVLLGAALMAVLVWGGVIAPGNVAQKTTAQPGGLVATTLPLSISNTDPLAKLLISSEPTAISFYYPSGGYITSCVTSGGICTTTGTSFSSGQNVVISMFTAGYVEQWIPLTIPYVTSGSAGLTTIPVALYQLSLGSYVPTFRIGTTSVSGGNNYNFTFPSTASQSVTVSMNYNGTADTGYLNSQSGCAQSQSGLQYDIINKICQSAVLQITDSSVGLSVKGMPRQFSSGSTRYWWAIMPDGVGILSPSNGGMGQLGAVKAPGSGADQGASDSNTGGYLTEQTIGNNLYGGTATANFQVQQGSVVTGQNESLIITLFINADPNYFPVNNNLGPNAVNDSTPYTLTFVAS